MDRCKQEEPKVINMELIEKCIREQYPKGEAGRLALLEGTPLEELKEIRFELMKILRIDHLWMMTSLVKLSLSNNLIEKIENLEALVNLVELNLSFNKISRIENLDALVNLENLSFFENRITKLENMQTLKKLIFFSVGRNCIEDGLNVAYMRRFKKLVSLNMTGNPCAETEDFRNFIGALLPQLVYYEYRLVQDYERSEGLETYGEILQSLVAVEEKENAIQAKIEADLAEAELQSESFVEFLGGRQLFDQMFENDEEGLALLELSGEVREFYKSYEKQFLHKTRQIFEFGQVQYHVRKDELEHYKQSVEGAKDKSQKESIEEMELFIAKKDETFQDVKQFLSQLKQDEITMEEFDDHYEFFSERYNELLHQTWKVLMKLELTVFEQLEDVNQTLELQVTEMINNFIEAAQAQFAEIRVFEQTYMENVSEEANAFLTLYSLDNDNVYMPPKLAPFMLDKEALNNALGATHDTHMQVIDAREDNLMKKARTWLANLVNNLTRGEVERSRAKVLEINHFLDIQREEFDELHAIAIGPPQEPDISELI